MARQVRIDYPGAYHHIMSQGFKREPLFYNTNDYEYYLDCINECKNFDFKILEYCLMPNHIHLLLRTGEIRLQKILKSIHTRFALFRNYKRKLTAIKEYKEFIRKPLKSDDEEYPLERFNNIAAGTKILYEKLLVNLSKEKRIEGKSFTRKINWLKRIDTFLNKNKVSIGSLQNNSSISAIRAKKEISYVLKVLCQKESY